ncbi:interleukin-17B [Callorhinus ursinus]|uniref:interleukin-17B n=1 Tax=Callorhinus ursinus TaxID=34884 RepID=UPI003CD0449A
MSADDPNFAVTQKPLKPKFFRLPLRPGLHPAVVHQGVSLPVLCTLPPTPPPPPWVDWLAPVVGLGCSLELFLLTLSIFLGLGQPRNPKGKRKGPGRPGTLAPGPHQVPLDLVSQTKPYARMEEYERNLGEMVAQLRNSSEPAKRKCEVNLQLWLSNKRSLSPWGYSINHDPSRIPVDLPEAQCLCLGCVNPFTMQEDRSMVSVPVFSQVPVRRRLCPLPPRTGPCRQRAVMETIAVGCTCIF